MSIVVKRLLKSAREEIAKKDFDLAKDYCNQVLESDSDNYNALVFLGVAEQNLNNAVASEKAYLRAVTLAPANPLALQGLANLYTTQENSEGLSKSWEDLRAIYVETKDGSKVADLNAKLVDLYGRTNQKLKAVEVLRSQVPGGACATVCSDSSPPPLELWQQIAALQESHTADTLKQEVELRRRRLGAEPIDILRDKVEKEVLLASQIADTYEHILALANYAVYADVGQKYLEFLDRQIQHVDADDKRKIHDRMVALAESILSRGCISSLSAEVLINSQDVPISDYDASLLNKLREYPPPVGPFASAYITWKEGNTAAESLNDLLTHLKPEPPCFLVRRMRGEIHLALRDYSSAATELLAAAELDKQYTHRTGVLRIAVTTSLNLSLARTYQKAGSRSLPDALAIYKTILQADPVNSEGLLGLGSVLLELQKVDESIKCLQKLVDSDEFGLAAKSELGWAYFWKGAFQMAIDLLKTAVEHLPDSTNLYRLGRCYWALEGAYRTDKQYCYVPWLQAAKLDPNNAPVFAFLGHYYAEVKNDQNRATRCYIRAISLDPGNEDAARALSVIYSQGGQLSAAEKVLGGYLARQPRSRWGWRQLGSLALATGNNVSAITHVQAALRIDSKDCRCWEALGEAYSLEGKYAAALKAYGRVIEQEPDSASLYHQVALLKQKLGLFAEAIENFRHALSLLETLHPSRPHLAIIQGLTLCQLSEAKRLFEEGSHGRCAHLLKEAFLHAVHTLEGSTLHSFAKILGDVCLAFQVLVPAHSHILSSIEIQKAISFLAKLVKSSESEPASSPAGSRFENLDLILQCAIAAFKSALTLSARSTSEGTDVLVAGYWHDLGLAYFYRSECASLSGSTGENAKFLDHAVMCAKMSIKRNPKNELYWNALAVYNLKIHPKLSQHALLKAIEINPASAPLWSNLGYLYLMAKDLELARKAFSQAQMIDPEWGLGWLGQGLAAEASGEDVLGSIEQAFDLGTHIALEINYFYAKALHRVAKTGRLADHHGTASLCLFKFTQQRPFDWAALNLLGLSLEREKQHEPAAKAFANALRALNGENLEAERKNQHMHAITENLARVLTSMRRFPAAVECHSRLSSLGPGDAYTHLSRGLALSFQGLLQEGLVAFEQALNSAANSPDVLNDVTLNLAQVLYALGSQQHQDLAKQQLLAIVARSPQNAKALMALCAFGLIRQDGALAQSAAAELLKISPEVLEQQQAEADHLLSSLFAIQGNMAAAKGFISKAVHRYPWHAERWRKLAQFIYQRSPDPRAGMVTSEAALVVGATASENTDLQAQALTTFGVAEVVLAPQSTPRGLRRTHRQRRRCIQTAVRAAPGDPANWMALGIETRARHAALGAEKTPSRDVADRCNALSRRLGEATKTVAETRNKQFGESISAEQKHQTCIALNWGILLVADSLVNETLLSSSDDAKAKLGTATTLASSVIQQAPAELHAFAYTICARAFRTAGDVPAAAQAYKQAVVLGRGHEDLAVLYASLRLYKAAEMCLRHALQAAPRVHARQRSTTLFRLARLAHADANAALATEAVNEGLKLNPSSVAGRCLQALAYSNSGSEAKAAKILRGMQDASPRVPRVAD
ncbi:Superkiller protein 3 [Geranomyces variabilis]|uniref:Superkiller protein 3 n=1 Tax=Geranomyces variabilis TaxID=109894 RepID=A0AAD5TJ68_9FUNG|nr:Superkiller protein 3 [Geranomyces variabilis]